jgi:hypothetical protein
MRFSAMLVAWACVLLLCLPAEGMRCWARRWTSAKASTDSLPYPCGSIPELAGHRFRRVPHSTLIAAPSTSLLPTSHSEAIACHVRKPQNRVPQRMQERAPWPPSWSPHYSLHARVRVVDGPLSILVATPCQPAYKTAPHGTALCPLAAARRLTRSPSRSSPRPRHAVLPAGAGAPRPRPDAGRQRLAKLSAGWGTGRWEAQERRRQS